MKVRGGSLGWFLCWAVVFADIGTSVYYTPGILFPQFGGRSALFVAMTLVVFILLTLKYAEVAWRFPEGGGVVNVAAQALHPFIGLLGGCFILVDYFLTAALSALSGVFYLAVVVPAISPRALVVAITIIALVILGALNLLGVKDSARVSAAFAVLAAAGQLLVVVAVAVSLGPAGIVHSFHTIAEGPRLTPLVLITGYAAAFLAFSGLETIAQLAPAMREPRRKLAGQAMALVVMTMVVTSPLLTLWSTTLLDTKSSDPNQFVSLLGAHVAGPVVGGYVAVSASLLLIFASNTAVIGCYHVFIALSRMGFLPRLLEQRNRWRSTPQWSILMAVAIPVALVAASRGDPGILGDLYAFGLLGAFILTSLALDRLRWFDSPGGRDLGAWLKYSVGLLTTALVSIAWLTNLVAKPLATLFGGGITVLGLVFGLTTYYYSRGREPAVFPFLHRPGLPVVHFGSRGRLAECQVLAILPHDPEIAEAVVRAAVRAADGGALAFLYRGDAKTGSQEGPEFMEVHDPYLKDRRAQVAFARAERAARKRSPDRRYIYVPGILPQSAVGDVWKAVFPKQTVVMDGGDAFLPGIAVDRVRRTYVDGYPILRLVSGRLRQPAAAS
ncbi:MAG: APC family permease [Candidatus Dormibacteraeota bacterium]|nr:APC family permease [Candidatus Dormibacteraeota bacterium]